MVALSLFFTVFFALQSATALRRLVIRQTDSSSCDSECAAFNNESNTCNQTVVQDIATCYDCMIQIGQFSQVNAQATLNDFVHECDDEGTPVTNITLSAAGSSPGGAPLVSGAKTTPAPTTTAAKTEPTETDGEDSTDAGEDSTDAGAEPTDTQSANASGSASAAAPGNTTSTALGTRCGVSVVGTVALVALSFVVGL
ncbi:hypothetical protein B0H14DRAFT_3491826 [Mycena olivaceomarginata]|nr:hypothetical protein B0H14DRAFT_3491826 [Mycena olivaceomarginata]